MRQKSFGSAGATGGAARLALVAALFVALGVWRIVATADASKAAVQLVMAAGGAALAGVLLFLPELRRRVSGPVLVALVLALLVWLVLSLGVTELQWGLLPS